ncbi:uncharacterized protein METZ01_LOCUS333178, partial [marine metagenome]
MLAFFLIFFTYFFNLKKKQPPTKNLDQIKTIEPDGKKEKMANTFFDVQYN